MPEILFVCFYHRESSAMDPVHWHVMWQEGTGDAKMFAACEGVVSLFG